jgi:TonB-linked SusC/RagA family outer membrane protein
MGIYLNDSLGAKGGFIAPTSNDNHDASNPIAVAWTNNSLENTKGVTGNIYGGIEFFKGLVYKTLVGIDYRNEMNTFFLRKPDIGSSPGITKTSLDKSSREITNMVLDNTLSFERTFGKLFVKSVVGYSEERRTNSYFWAKRQGFFDNSQEMPLSTGDKLTQENAGELYESALQSYLGRVELGYADKYLATINFRNDGSSKFGNQMKHGTFFSWSAAWRISEENFMKTIPEISDLKVRLSGGTLGNQNIGDYKYEASLNSNLNYVLGSGTTQVLVTGTAPDNFPNELVQWETTRQTDIGLDLGMFGNKLYFTGDYYIKNTEDMLVDVPIPGSSGFNTNPTLNTGEILNRGLELSLTYKEYKGDFHYSIGGNFTSLHNEVISLGNGGEPIMAGKVENGNAICRTEVGYSIASFYLYKTDGIYKNQAEIDAMNTAIDAKTGKQIIFAPKAKPGDIRFVDKDKDGKLTDKDREVVGSSIPKLIYGLNFSADYKGFDFAIFLQGVYGNKIYNEMKFWTEGMFGNWNGDAGVIDRFRESDVTYSTTTPEGKKVDIFYPANTDTDVPRAIRQDPNKNSQLASTRFLEDGSYIRLKSLSLGYNLPKRVLEKLKISKLRVYVTGENLMTFTKYSGYDPEIGSNPIGDSGGGINIVRGIDNGYYPQARTFLTGIQLSF